MAKKQAMCMFAAAAIAQATSGSADGLLLVQLERARHVAPAAGSAGSLPPMPAQFPTLERCASDSLWDWRKRGKTTAAFLDVWTDKRPTGAVVQSDVEDSCILRGMAPTKHSNVALTLVKEAEADICNVKLADPDHPPEDPTGNLSFPVLGRMQERAPERRYQIIWPTGRTCDAENKCPVLMFFHGCGRQSLPYDQAVRDAGCAADLKSVIVVPWLDDMEERWTERSEALNEFIIPLWQELLEKHPGIDGDRATVAGASLGSGMALQTGLLRPDLFSAIVAGGFADGSHCAGDDPKSIAIPYDHHKLPAAEDIPKLDKKEWKLKLITIIMGEKELLLDEKVSSMLDMLDEAKVPEKTALHLRLYGEANHPQCSIYGFNQWKGLHRYFWGAEEL